MLFGAGCGDGVGDEVSAPPKSDPEAYTRYVVDQAITRYETEGLDVKGWVGTDINGYNFGPQMLAATEAGRWVPYVYVNPSARGPR